MKRRAIGALCTLALMSSAATGPVAQAFTSSESGVHFTSKVVTIPRGLVKRDLVGIAPNGTFRFKHATGALAKLRPGKIMLLQGSDAVRVKSISHKKGRLFVATKPAEITEVISSGKISFSGAPDFRQAFLSKITPASATASSASFSAPSYPYVGSPATFRARSAAGPSLSAQGSEGPFGYSLTFTPSTATRLDISGTLCFISGSVCANGPANGLSAEVNLSGYIDAGETSGGISVSGGGVTDSSIAIKSLAVHGHITYTIARGEGGAENGDPPVFRVPIGVDYTIPGEIPIYLKLQTALLLKMGVSSKNATIHGGVEVNTTGSDTVTQNGNEVSGSDTAPTLSGEVLDQSDGGVPPSISLAPSGVVVAVQFPKLGVGLGVTSVNGIAYVDLVSSVGQTVGGAIAGMLCSSYDVDITAGAGLEAQIGLGKLGLSVASPKKILFEKMFQTHDPGCPQV
jgi:hypothetical protein